MSYTNFKPTFWAKEILEELRKSLILADFCYTAFEGDAKKGEKVKILGIGDVTIGTYTGGSIGDPQIVDDTSVEMAIDQYKFFNVAIDDIDAAQCIPGVMEKILGRAKYGLRLAADTYVASKAVDAYTLSATTQVNSAATAQAAADAMILALHEQNVEPGDDVVMELPWFMYKYLKDKYIDLDTNNSELIKKGIVGRYDDVFVRPTNNLYDDGTDKYAMCRTRNAIAFAAGIDKVEPYRPDTLFEDAVKGLYCFGAKVVRPKELAVAKVHK